MVKPPFYACKQCPLFKRFYVNVFFIYRYNEKCQHKLFILRPVWQNIKLFHIHGNRISYKKQQQRKIKNNNIKIIKKSIVCCFFIVVVSVSVVFYCSKTFNYERYWRAYYWITRIVALKGGKQSATVIKYWMTNMITNINF
jgi:hypothetical protein